HDARLHRLVHRPAADDTGGDLLDRIGGVGLDRPLAVDGFAQHVHDASEQPLAHRHLQEVAGGAGLAVLFELGVVAEDDHAHFGLFEIQHQAGNAVAQVDHLVEHRVGQPFDLGDAVAELADDADVLPGRRRLGARDLRFNLLQQVRHAPSLQKLFSNSANPLRTLPSYTSLPTWIRVPPISAGRRTKAVLSPAP